MKHPWMPVRARGRAVAAVGALFVGSLATLAAQQPPAPPAPPAPPVTSALPAAPVPPLPPVPPPPPLPPAFGREMNITIMRDGPGGAQTHMIVAGDEPFDFTSLPLGMGGEPVAGAPYSAEAVTEVVQVLADGNRITRQSKTSLYRDASGRTRREGGVAMLGGLVGRPRSAGRGGAGDAGAGGPGGPGGNDASVQIHDPEAGALFLLDVDRKEARRLPAPRIRVAARTEARSAPGRSDREVTTIVRHGREVRDTNVESLGTKSIEGVQAEGTRTTMTIPAGQIGNEQPIHIVSERWYSPELRVLVMSRQSDPRFGDTTYRLTNIVRAEPAPELFRVPPDYKIVDRLPELTGLGERIRKEVDEHLRREGPATPGDRPERRSREPQRE